MRRPFLLAAFFACGCYSYTPIAPADLQPGLGVRARVNAETAERVEPLLGVADARVLAGVVVSTSPETLLVEVPTSARAEVGNAVQRLHQRIAIPRSSLVEIESRTLNRLRTGLVVGGITGLAAALVIKSVAGGPGDEGPPGNGELPELRAALFRIPIP